MLLQNLFRKKKYIINIHVSNWQVITIYFFWIIFIRKFACSSCEKKFCHKICKYFSANYILYEKSNEFPAKKFSKQNMHQFPTKKNL